MNSYTHGSLQEAEHYEIYEFEENKTASVPGYLVVSTATLNVEQEANNTRKLTKPANSQFFLPKTEQDETSTKEMLAKIARYLIETEEPEIVINIHGYSSTPSDTEKGCKKIYDYVNENIKQKNKYLFIGYRWPSENPFKEDQSGTFKEKLGYALKALPILLAGILSSGIVISIISTLLLLFFYPSSIFVHLLTALLVPFGMAFSIVLTLILLRISAYFRDVYRATNYGVLDLVELLRQLDYTIHKEIKDKRIKLSFIGHSMGCFVATNAIRIVSDVFDVQSINKTPSPNIGNVFYLGQLVLVAPDIPVETILPGRANFLRSSLRRFQEAYIFCNEGDLPLRITSTAANYFSFPAKTRISGYRLGNVTVSHFTNQNDKVGHLPKYGIVNLARQVNTDSYILERPYKYLEIRSSNREHRKLEEMRKFSETELQPADLFTYFDCTDYKDDKSKKVGIVSLAIQKPAMNFWDYVSLTFAFTRKTSRNDASGGVDTHTGYFQGQFSQQAIYKLAFLGFQGFLDSAIAPNNREEQIQSFSQECQHKQIQVILAPYLYQKTQMNQ